MLAPLGDQDHTRSKTEELIVLTEGVAEYGERSVTRAMRWRDAFDAVFVTHSRNDALHRQGVIRNKVIPANYEIDRLGQMVSRGNDDGFHARM